MLITSRKSSFSMALFSMVLAQNATRDYGDYAARAFARLQSDFWQPSAGLWRASMWWQTANTIEALSNLALLQPQLQPAIEAAVATVFNATSNSTHGRCDKGVDLTFSGYFDDEEWWGLAWLKAYELTSDRAYLNRSRAIFDDLVSRSWSNASCGGGVCWQASQDPANMKACYKNAITNELVRRTTRTRLYGMALGASCGVFTNAPRLIHSFRSSSRTPRSWPSSIRRSAPRSGALQAAQTQSVNATRTPTHAGGQRRPARGWSNPG